ncbi:tachykinin-3a [Aplochiton taeniatus]
MRRGLLLVALFLIMKLRYSHCGCMAPAGLRRSTSSDENSSSDTLQRNILKRYSDLDYDSFVGLMGRRSADINSVPSPHKRDMDDIFVGLMGRRSTEPGNGPWKRKEYPEARGIFFNKCRLRQDT